jgi:hypothetical protein
MELVLHDDGAYAVHLEAGASESWSEPTSSWREKCQELADAAPARRLKGAITIDADGGDPCGSLRLMASYLVRTDDAHEATPSPAPRGFSGTAPPYEGRFYGRSHDARGHHARCHQSPGRYECI